MERRFVGSVMLLALVLVSPMFASGGAEKTETLTAAGSQLLPWKGAPVVYSGFGADLGIKEDPASPVMQAYRATTGNVSIKWETVPWNDYWTKLNLYINSGDLPEIMWSGNSLFHVNVNGPKGFFLDWDKYKQHMPNVQKWAATLPGVNNILTGDGARYAVTDIVTAEYMGEGWFYNPALLSKAGVSAPPDDLAQMLDVMKKVKAAQPAADGYYSYWGMSYLKQAFAHAMNVKLYVQWDFAAKRWIYGPTMDPGYKKLISYLAAMYQAGLLNPEILTLGTQVSTGGDREREILEAGNYSFSYHYYGEGKQSWLDKGKAQVLKGMRPPKAEDGKRYYWITVARESTVNWGYIANAKVKRPELLAAYVDNIMSYKTYELFEWGLDGVTFKRTADGGYEYLPEFLKDDVGGLRGGQKLQKQGVGSIQDPRYIHYNDYKIVWFSKYFMTKGDGGREACAADTRALQKGELVPTWYHPFPTLGAEAVDEFAKIINPVNTFVDEEGLKFITGRRPMSEWDDFIAQANKMGDIAKAVGHVNSARQFPVTERLYPLLPPDLK